MSHRTPENGKELSRAETYRSQLNKAGSFSEVWETVKDTVMRAQSKKISKNQTITT